MLVHVMHPIHTLMSGEFFFHTCILFFLQEEYVWLNIRIYLLLVYVSFCSSTKYPVGSIVWYIKVLFHPHYCGFYSFTSQSNNWCFSFQIYREEFSVLETNTTIDQCRRTSLVKMIVY